MVLAGVLFSIAPKQFYARVLRFDSLPRKAVAVVGCRIRNTNTGIQHGQAVRNSTVDDENGLYSGGGERSAHETTIVFGSEPPNNYSSVRMPFSIN